MDQPLLQHLLTRLLADVDFLASQSLISHEDASFIRSKLPAPSAGHQLNQQLGQLNLGSSTGEAHRAVPPPPPAATATGSGVAQQQPKRTCRATWDYNATQPDDLQFRKGDVIELVAEANADWWRGSINGRTGIFPSNYVEKLDSPSAPAPSHSPAPVSAYPSSSTTTLYPNSTGASLYSNSPSPSPSFVSPANSFAPPPPSQQPQYPYQQPQPYAASYHGPPPQNQWDEKQGYQQGQVQQFDQNQVQQQQAQMQAQQPNGAPPIPPKKNQHKFAKLMGTSFAGGVGFGTGTAVAQNAINAIF